MSVARTAVTRTKTQIRRHYFESSGAAWARLVSDLLSPPVIWGALAFPVALSQAPSVGHGLSWVLVYVTLICVLPVIYIAMMVKRGKITDIHMQVRQQRIRPFVVSLVCTTIAWWTLRFMGAPSVLPMFALFTLIQMGIMAVITLVWQISLHAMSVTGAVVALGFMFGGAAALITAPFIILVGAARLNLKRHTMAQVLAGAALGAIVPLIMLSNMIQ
jgi:membrane-associated phospholipid phosphatase